VETDAHTSLAARLRQIPYWLVMTVFLGLLLLWSILFLANETWATWQ